MSSWQVVPCTIEDVLPFARLAAAEHVSVKRDLRTRWWAVPTSTGRLLGFAGLWVGPSLARFKGAWTDPGERGRGIGAALVDTILEAAPTDRPLEVIHVRGGNPDFWPGHGLAYTGRDRPNGGRVYRRGPA